MKTIPKQTLASASEIRLNEKSMMKKQARMRMDPSLSI